MLGFFGVAPDVDVRIPTFPSPLQLTFVLLARAGEGRYTVSFEILGQDDARVLPAPTGQETTVAPGPKTNLMIQVLTQYPTPGRYRFRLLVDGRPHYEARFDLSEGSVVV
jgi:hypothetical protein